MLSRPGVGRCNLLLRRANAARSYSLRMCGDERPRTVRKSIYLWMNSCCRVDFHAPLGRLDLYKFSKAEDSHNISICVHIQRCCRHVWYFSVWTSCFPFLNFVSSASVVNVSLSFLFWSFYGISCSRSLFFGDYMVPDSPERIYDEVTDLAHLTQQMEGWVY